MLRYYIIALFGFTPFSQAALPQSFLAKHCYQCHGPDKQKADRRFDKLSPNIENFQQQEHWQEIVDQLNLGEMPPEDEPQPTQAERLAAINSLTEGITTAREKLKGAGQHTTLRRLNKVEYRQTIGDLLGLNVEAWDPSEDLPADVTHHGFDNNGAQLVTSGLLLEKYLPAAEAAIQRATHFEEKPESKHHTQSSPFYFQGKESKNLPKLFLTGRFRFVPETPYTDLYGRHYRGGHLGFLPLYQQGGVPHSGQYTIRVRAASVDRTHDYRKGILTSRNGDPLVLELASVDRQGSVTSAGSVRKMVSLNTYELTEPKPKWIEWTGYLEKGYEPEVRFRNGTLSAKNLVFKLSRLAQDRPEIKPFLHLKPGNERGHGILRAYQGPKLRVWEIQVEGPHLPSWPPPGHQLLYGKLKPADLNREIIHERLSLFAQHAFRRTPNKGELQPILSLVSAKLDAGVTPLKALQLGFQTILCSPGFLYLREDQGDLNPHALASRLSYFLWSSLPDESLLHLAENNTLNDPKVLKEQVDQMLNNQKSERFSSNFLRIWLELDNIGEMPPSTDFRNYYRDNLESAMRKETEHFFSHLLQQNLPLREFLTADYSFLNRELAKHYGISGVEGTEFRKVDLPKATRGGILGHGSFLTASANGVDTSPVVRGIYVMNKLLDYTPPPPPDDVPEIEPDVRGATTLRQQLVKHRADATCAQCHNKIDPAGFALENYDAIGTWRDRYSDKLAVDSSGKLHSGETFSTNPEFRQLIASREKTFTRCLTKKLLTYAIGRELNSNDRPTIDRICQEMAGPEKGLRDLIQAVVTSTIFRQN
ncbi:MAG: DUF1592 domain-containing protein [Akkermansiaceae bacterium]|nr:DUF1592 domain-containing protein [Akkermansiaceae bacterium]